MFCPIGLLPGPNQVVSAAVVPSRLRVPHPHCHDCEHGDRCAEGLASGGCVLGSSHDPKDAGGISQAIARLASLTCALGTDRSIFVMHNTIQVLLELCCMCLSEWVTEHCFFSGWMPAVCQV